MFDLFPTRVGMNRKSLIDKDGMYTVPHASGDEPALYKEINEILDCSPREWG